MHRTLNHDRCKFIALSADNLVFIWGFLPVICRITRRSAAQNAALRSRWEGLWQTTSRSRQSPEPRLPRGVRLVHNEAQGGWVLLAPERIFKADAIAVEVLKRCTGEATLDAIVDDLAKTFNAPRERIHADVSKLLGGLAEKRLLEL